METTELKAGREIGKRPTNKQVYEAILAFLYKELQNTENAIEAIKKLELDKE